MRIVVAVVGKPRDANLAAAIAEFEARARRYWPIESKEVRGESGRSAADAVVRERESQRLADVVPKGAHVALCDVGGRQLSSEQFAAWLQKQRESARDLAIVIGGALGVSEALRAAANTRLALAPWTLSHELARLVLAEQLYRAGTIIRGEPYHK